MPIEMPKGLPLSVDTWTPSSQRKRYHFVTHAHKDHSLGISKHSSYPIYSTHLTKSLLLQSFPQLDDSLFVGIEVGQSVVIDDWEDPFTVTAFDANHCPGAVMFLFEGNFGNILHTGDCRLTPECLQKLPEKYIGKKNKEPRCRLDYVFLDCTFGKDSLEMPSKHSAIRQVISCIWKHPGAPLVYLTCDLLGQEEILENVSQTFGAKIFIDKESNPECFESLMLIVPEIISQDPSSRFHLFDGFPNLYERAEAKLAEAQASFRPEPLIIRPSTQWYACEERFSEFGKKRKERLNEAVRDPFGIWHVCYSMHSSRGELEWALQLLAPKRVISTTPSCRAMELDYVRKHCFNAQLASDDPIWKLLNISVEAPLTTDVLIKASNYSPLVEKTIQSCSELRSQAMKMSTSQKALLNVSPPIRQSPVTLFGRARLGLQESTLLHEEKEIIVSLNDNLQDSILLPEEVGTVPSNDDPDISFQNDVEAKCKPLVETKKGVDVTETKCDKSTERKTETCKRASYSPIGSSKNFNESFRKLYRSMNVPVPQPLPSLVELMNANRRTKRKF